MALALGCGTEPSDGLSRCGTTGEFGNTGCAEVAGTVTDANGAPVGDAFVSVPGAVDPARVINLVYDRVQTDSSGSYRLRAIRMDGEVPTSGPDTVTVWVAAVLPPPPGSPNAPGLTDSVQARVQIQPVGSIPVVVQAATLVVRAP